MQHRLMRKPSALMIPSGVAFGQPLLRNRRSRLLFQGAYAGRGEKKISFFNDKYKRQPLEQEIPKQMMTSDYLSRLSSESRLHGRQRGSFGLLGCSLPRPTVTILRLFKHIQSYPNAYYSTHLGGRLRNSTIGTYP